MSEMKDYLESKLNEFKCKHDIQAKLNRYDGEIKKQWKCDCERTRELWQEVNSVADVQDYIGRYVFLVEQEEQLKTTDLYTYDVDLALYRAVYAIQKMVRCFDMAGFDFGLLDKAAIDDLFASIYGAFAKMENVIVRRTMWN